METMLVTFGVSLAKKGILTASLTQRQIFLTNSGSLKEININSLGKIRHEPVPNWQLKDILFGVGVGGWGFGELEVALSGWWKWKCYTISLNKSNWVIIICLKILICIVCISVHRKNWMKILSEELKHLKTCITHLSTSQSHSSLSHSMRTGQIQLQSIRACSLIKRENKYMFQETLYIRHKWNYNVLECIWHCQLPVIHSIMFSKHPYFLI